MAKYRMGVRVPNEPIEYFTELEQLEAWARNADLFISADEQLKNLNVSGVFLTALGITLYSFGWTVTGVIVGILGLISFACKWQVNHEFIEYIYNGDDKALICAFDEQWRFEARNPFYTKYWWRATYKRMLLRADRYYPHQ